MTKKKDNDMEIMRKNMEALINKRYKRPVWDQIKDAFGVFLMAFGILICLAVVVVLIVMLIDNPVSLAIVCLTIFLIWVWSNK